MGTVIQFFGIFVFWILISLAVLLAKLVHYMSTRRQRKAPEVTKIAEVTCADDDPEGQSTSSTARWFKPEIFPSGVGASNHSTMLRYIIVTLTQMQEEQKRLLQGVHLAEEQEEQKSFQGERGRRRRRVKSENAPTNPPEYGVVKDTQSVELSRTAPYPACESVTSPQTMQATWLHAKMAGE